MNDPHRVDEIIASLRPDAALDEAYRRRRAADLSRAMAAAPRRRPRWRWAPALAGVAAAGAAAALVLPSAFPAPAARPAPAASAAATAGAEDRVVLTPRSFLLAAAQTAARGGDADGRYWYARTRTLRPGQAPRIDEAWYSGRDGLLISDGKRQEFSGITLKWRIGEHEVGIEELRRLPGDVAGLRAWLGAADPLPAAFHLLGSATTARTRAAMYAVLAERPDLTLARDAVDALGRTGVAISGPTARLIVDPADARLLSIEYTRSTGEPRREGRSVFLPAEAGTVIVYEATGWTDTLDRP